jgi:hypothetical protein
MHSDIKYLQGTLAFRKGLGHGLELYKCRLLSEWWRRMGSNTNVDRFPGN